jgi:hypothetical protein
MASRWLRGSARYESGATLLRGSLVALSCWVVGGCYQFRPISGVPRETGASVRVSLTDRGSVDLAPYIGPTIVKVDGRLESASDSAFTLLLANVIARNGVETAWAGEKVLFHTSYVSRLESRRLDTRRSWLAAAVVVGGTVALGRVFSLFGGSSSGKTGGSGDPR